MKNDSELVVYHFCRVVFGINGSPFLLNATLRHHIESFIEDPDFVRKMLEGFHVDDLVSGDKTSNLAGIVYGKAKSRFRLRKWLTNSLTLREQIGICESKTENESAIKIGEDQTYVESTSNNQENSTEQKVLGLTWNCSMNEIKFKFSKLTDRGNGLKVTKKIMLSVMAELYNSLGIISPVSASNRFFLGDLSR